MPKNKKEERHKNVEYDHITPYIIVGNNSCCLTHFKKSLLMKGVMADISLEYERLDAPYGIKYFLWLPVHDHTAPTQTQLMVGANALDDLVKSKIKTYVHCKNGHGRAPTLIAAYFILKGMSAEKALRLVESKRRGAHIEPPQLLALKQFVKTVAKTKHKH